MDIAKVFMRLARDKLPKEEFEELYHMALNVKKADHSKQAAMPNIVTRLEKRFKLVTGPYELDELSATIRAGGDNVRLVRTQMVAIGHYEVDWRGKHIVVVYDASRERLITAHTKTSNRGKRIRNAGLRREKSRLRRLLQGLEDD